MWAMPSGWNTEGTAQVFTFPVGPPRVSILPPSTLTTLSKDPKLFTEEEKLVITPKSHNMSPGGGGREDRTVHSVYKSSDSSPGDLPRRLTRILPPSCFLCDFRTWLHWTSVRLSPSRLCFQHRDWVWGKLCPF